MTCSAGECTADTSSSRIHEIRALGLRFHPMTKSTLLDQMFKPRASGERMIVGGANLHGLYVNHHSADYDALLQKPETVVIIDGMPVIWMLRLLGHTVDRSHRITWVDWFEDALARAAHEGRAVFILGHTPQILAEGLAKARAKWPSLRIDGTHGFFAIGDNAPDARAAIETVNAFAPDILIVGMGMPRQEIFTLRFGSRLNAPVIGLGGAAFAYFAGFEPTPPRWMGRWGLEWSHRLFADPRRMAFRYLIEPLFLSFYLGRRLLGGR
jgi:N-acetylglucosaminyldiphosphoundecaprenol N-acetyl-beta-D-mannosaminyltransferase